MAQTQFDDRYAFLTDLEKEKVEQFYSDELMREAVRKVLLLDLYGNGTLQAGKPALPLRNGALSIAFAAMSTGQIDTEKIGADLLAMAQGINTLENGFNELSKIKKLVPAAPKQEQPNPAL